MKRILLLYTGGTIGCEGSPLAPMSAERFGRQLGALGPLSADVVLHALSQPLDSANVQPADWLEIQAQLLDAWAEFDGFVVLHGTDTLAYTASALSFLLVGMDKPVVLTGSQLPLSAADSDAPRNLREAIAVARQSSLCEVVVCFAGRVMRGNRCVKRSASRFDAFDSPNWPDVGTVDEEVVSLDVRSMLPPPHQPFAPGATSAGLADARERLANNPVWLVHVHPGFPVALLHAALSLPRPPRGWVLACYGVGNAPDNAEFLAALQMARRQGVALVAVTQTGHGIVDLQTYHAGSGLAAAGVISGRDLTIPAALVKLQILLANGTSPDDLAKRMASGAVGESG